LSRAIGTNEHQKLPAVYVQRQGLQSLHLIGLAPVKVLLYLLGPYHQARTFLITGKETISNTNTAVASFSKLGSTPKDKTMASTIWKMILPKTTSSNCSQRLCMRNQAITASPISTEPSPTITIPMPMFISVKL